MFGKRSKAPETPPEPSISPQSGAQPDETAFGGPIDKIDIGNGDPFDAGDIREALGFDRDDPNVHVRFRTLLSEGELADANPDVTAPVTDEATPADRKKLKRILQVAQEREQVTSIVMDVIDELLKSKMKHADMHSAHEGHSVIREEFEELWEHVKADTGKSPEARKEALQLAAMAVRYVLDVVDA